MTDNAKHICFMGRAFSVKISEENASSTNKIDTNGWYFDPSEDYPNPL
jgi:hypothetical protein